MSSCPHCHQPVTAGDDICENCGAVLSTLQPMPAFTVASTSAAIAVASRNACPNCKQSVGAGDDICEHCGMVLSAVPVTPTAPVTVTPLATPVPALTECPQCHTSRKGNGKFCNHCGYSYVAAANSPNATVPVPVAQNLPVASQQLKIGSVLNDKYKIKKAIGAGGMGAVYLAEDQVLKRPVVIKALLSDADADLVAQSVKEREFLATIKHANIVSIYDFITVASNGYIVMEYVQGKTLDQMLEERGRPFDVPDAIRYILGILPAFSYLAKLDLVYCDFKPQNVMVETLKDGSQVVKLIDLGTVIKHVPNPGDVYGTHGYYAPEAVKTPSPETDLYSICRTLAYMVSMMDLGTPIFGMPSSEYYKAFRDYPALYRLLSKGTSSRPAQRFHSAEDLSDQLSGVLRQIVGGSVSVPIASKMFVPGIMTTTGKLGLRGEAALDEHDKAIDHLRFGDQSLRAGNYSGALKFYKQAVHVNPKSIDAYLRIAEIYIDQGDYASALSEVTMVQRLAPGHWKVSWYTGRLLEAQGNYSKALEQYRELVADLPGELPPQQSLARIYARMGDHLEAIDLYNSVLRADPGNTEAVLGVTDSLLNLQRWDEAAQVLSSINESAARYIDAQLLLCDLYIARMNPLTPQNVEQAAHVVNTLSGRTEDVRYFLARGDIYRAAWQLARKRQLPTGIDIAGVADTKPRTLGRAAEESYRQYLRRASHPANRESIVRHKREVTPWRMF